VALTLTGSPDEPDLLFLPWELPLEEWPDSIVVSLPRGISRHVVRFVSVNERIYAVKEVEQPLAEREYALLTELDRRGVPGVEPIGVAVGRRDATGEALPACLVTRHLQFSLPYRALFSGTPRASTVTRLMDALAVLLVRLHLTGFSWNDCSLSNTLFRRDAGAFAAYLVDAETGEMHPRLTDGQRAHDVEVAATNVTGELMDLEAGGTLHPSMDPVALGEGLVRRYHALWTELTEPLVIGSGERYLLDARIRRLNDLGYDIAELQVSSDGSTISVSPKVVDAGHHSRRLMELTGLDVEENQARRLLNDVDTYRLTQDPESRLDEPILAHRWVTDRFEPVVAAIPEDLRAKLEPAEVFHEILEHLWFTSEQAGRDIGLATAAADYLDTQLPNRPDEAAILGASPGEPPLDPVTG
jgi:hypothetical protein